MQKMEYQTEFQGFFAEFYDMLHGQCEDAIIYPEFLKPYGKRILELGSGTGRIAIPLAQAGYRVTGIEAEPDMIRLMEAKAYPRENLTVVREDARRFSLDSRFDAILLTCNFLNHFPDATDVAAILARCRDHLSPGGMIVIDCSAPDAASMAETGGHEEAFTFSTPRGTVIKDYFLPRYDLLNQLEYDLIRLEEWHGNRLIREACVEEVLTWYYPREIRSLIREAGLSISMESDRLTADGAAHPIGEHSQQMLFCCKRR